MADLTVSTETLPPLAALYARRRICDSIIRTLMAENDPRAPAAVEHYRQQLATIDSKIVKLEIAERQRLGLPEPEPITVGLRSVTLGAETPKG